MCRHERGFWFPPQAHDQSADRGKDGQYVSDLLIPIYAPPTCPDCGAYAYVKAPEDKFENKYRYVKE